MYEHVEIRLDDMNLTTIDCFYCMKVNINTYYFYLPRSKYGCSGQANIAQSNHGDGTQSHLLPLNQIA
ncbi:hypothetical protein D3C76_1779320 [compost metagenome]